MQNKSAPRQPKTKCEATDQASNLEQNNAVGCGQNINYYNRESLPELISHEQVTDCHEGRGVPQAVAAEWKRFAGVEGKHSSIHLQAFPKIRLEQRPKHIETE